MVNVTSGVYPVFDNVFKIGTKGVDSEDADMKTIAEIGRASCRERV